MAERLPLDVAIVGGGPVGLALASLLALRGINVAVFEQRRSTGTHTRAIGIHPPGLRVLERIGVAADLTARGVRIQRGEAVSGGRRIASLSFSTLPGAYPYVLAVPQPVTQGVLEDRLERLAPGALHRSARITGVDAGSHCVTLTGMDDGGPLTVHSRLLVGADGPQSTVRELAGIGFRSRGYPDHYLMGDFPDGTGSDAAVLHLSPAGIVESFPLPGATRRWVARMPGPVPRPSAAQLAGIIATRTGVAVDHHRHTMLSSFGVEARLANAMVSGRVALIGDAAHQISPIGGLGMNLGWLDAESLAPIIGAALAGEPTGAALAAFQRSRLAAARRAMRHSELNMRLGRPMPGPVLDARNAVVSALMGLPAVHQSLARRFTMATH
ncbi:FAD-dependent oxidoreductase [Pseudarthrobacter sp. P1]|uniref:FAD-dependent oxidoreductase n=1 Tax=Pseudarthrobacter sp. P1 TaxID=3418418 RepID=UPI003CF1E2F5